MFLLYNFLMTITAPIWVPWMLIKAKRRKEQPNWKERQGDFDIEPRKDRKRVWVHAVSVGEVVAVMPILREVKALLPEHEIVLSVTTSSGHQTAREKAADLYHHLVYFPLDVPRMQLAAMQRVQPAVIAIMETELWFNFLWAANTFEAQTMLINGRISDRSFPRSMKLRFFYRRLLEMMGRCLMQTEKDAQRIKALGARDAEVFGNCKFDQAAEGLDADPAHWRRELGLAEGRPVVVIGSTRGAEEEAFVLEALKGLVPEKVQVIHAPRHLERVGELASQVTSLFGGVALRSQGQIGPYLLLDTYGELSNVYSAADIVVIGGGFSNLGGQNLLQPLAHGKPVLHGPHMQNFREVAEAAAGAGATGTCSTPSELHEALVSLIEDPVKRERMGEAAQALVASNLGASKRYAEAIAEEVGAFEREALSAN